MEMIDGKRVAITVSSFKNVCNLQKALADALKDGGIKFNLTGFKLDIKDIQNMEIGDIGGIVESVLSVLTDEKLRDQLFICCDKVVLGEEKVNAEFFDEEKNRKYYYPLMFEVLKRNLSSFFGLLSFGSFDLSGLSEIFQKFK